jgi:hypothetical protein
VGFGGFVGFGVGAGAGVGLAPGFAGGGVAAGPRAGGCGLNRGVTLGGAGGAHGPAIGPPHELSPQRYAVAVPSEPETLGPIRARAIQLATDCCHCRGQPCSASSGFTLQPPHVTL